MRQSQVTTGNVRTGNTSPQRSLGCHSVLDPSCLGTEGRGALWPTSLEENHAQRLQGTEEVGVGVNLPSPPSCSFSEAEPVATKLRPQKNFHRKWAGGPTRKAKDSRGGRGRTQPCLDSKPLLAAPLHLAVACFPHLLPCSALLEVSV